jgi:ribosomal protein S18 acetylase RimI-like enzyme
MSRRLGPGDEELVQKVSERFKVDVPSAEAAHAFLGDPRHIVVAEVEDEDVIGFAYGYVLDRIDGRRMVLFYELEVAEGARGRGFGSGLTDAMVAEARRAGAYKMWVQTGEDNEPAVRTYAGAGAHRVAVDVVFGPDL